MPGRFQLVTLQIIVLPLLITSVVVQFLLPNMRSRESNMDDVYILRSVFLFFCLFVVLYLGICLSICFSWVCLWLARLRLLCSPLIVCYCFRLEKYEAQLTDTKTVPPMLQCVRSFSLHSLACICSVWCSCVFVRLSYFAVRRILRSEREKRTYHRVNKPEQVIHMSADYPSRFWAKGAVLCCLAFCCLSQRVYMSSISVTVRKS